MRKIVISILIFVLVFSELNVFVAETIVNDPIEPEIECEEQLETEDVENIATECQELETENSEDLATEGEGQPETENSSEDPTTEGKEQPESESGEDPTTEGKEQPEPENGEDLTTEEEKEQGLENGENPSTEEEEQSESETEENLANACENQLETDSEENPATEGEEQPKSDSEKDPEVDCEEEPAGEEKPEIECEEGFYIEEELAVEGEEQLEPNNEEELAVKGEEQLEPNNEEEPVVEGEEQLEPNDEEEPVVEGEKQQAPQCKRAISKSGRGIWLEDVGKIGDIDFSKLDDSENELDEFTQMTENRGVEFRVKGENERKHYMYFGDVYNGRSIESLEQENSYVAEKDDWGRPLPDMETTLDSLVKGKKYVSAQNFQVMITLGLGKTSANAVATYFYKDGRGSFDRQSNGLVIAHGGQQNDVARFQSQNLPILKLYKNEKKQEIIAYAAVIDGTLYLDGYVKIKMSSVSSKGRINISVKYLKFSDDYEYTNFGYTVHMDIARNHKESKMYSMGNDEGFYYDQMMSDSRNYHLYHFRDGYENHPTQFEGTNNPIDKRPFGTGYPGNRYFDNLNSLPNTKDPGKDNMYYFFRDHPGWALRWDPEIQKRNEVRSASIEIAVSETKISDVLPEIQLDNDGEYTEGGYRIGGTWKAPDSEYISLYYTIDGGEPEEIQEFKNENPDIATSWEFKIPIAEGLDHDVTIYAKDEYGRQSNIETIKLRPTLAITEQVLNEDGNVPTEVAPGETLNYEILVNSGYVIEDKGTYGGVTITQKNDPHLEPPTDLKITDENGNEIGTVTFNATNNEIVAKPNADLPRSTKVKVTYKAKVKEEATEKEYVRGQAIVSGKYSTGDAVNQTSNEVKIMIIGVLKFVSAPQTISFGDKLTISPRTKTYYPIPIPLDESLAVKDSRPQSRNPSWTMTAKLIQPLTGKGTGSTLEGFRYRYSDNVSFLSTDASVQIYNKTTTNSEVVNISNTWNPDGDGLYLEVLPGTAKVGVEYEGIISWTLHDVQPNE